MNRQGQKCRRIAGDFDCHADAAVRRGVHLPIEHIQGFTRSHWMPPSGNRRPPLLSNLLNLRSWSGLPDLESLEELKDDLLSPRKLSELLLGFLELQVALILIFIGVQPVN